MTLARSAARLALSTTLVVSTSVAVTVGYVGTAAAQTNINMPKLTPAAGWETPAYARNYSQIGEKFSSAAVGDINGDGVQDIVAGFPDGHIYAWRTDNGQRFFQYFTGPGAVQASPVLVDYDRDGKKDIVFANTHGDIGAVRSDGRVLMKRYAGTGGDWTSFFGTPAVADLDNNGNLEVIATSFDQHMYVFMENGLQLPGFPIFLGDTSWSSPAVGDLDGDGWLEIVAGWDCDGAPGQTCAPQYGGYVGAWHMNGAVVRGWPKFISKQVVWSSPAIADLDMDGKLDVIVGTGNMPGTMWDNYKQKMNGEYVYAFRGDGSNVPGWPVYTGRNVTSSPAIGDINDDGRRDVAFVSEDGYLYAYSGNGQKLWGRCAGNNPYAPPNGGTANGSNCPGMHASPTIADIDGDGTTNVLIGGEQWLRAYDGNGDLHYSGETASGTDPMTAAPTVAQIGGRTWIIEVSSNGNTGRIFAWTTNRPLGDADWGTFKQNAQRTGSNVALPRPTGARPATPLPAGTILYKNAYKPEISRIDGAGRQIVVTYAEWAASGFPSPRPAPTTYLKYSWSPNIFAMTQWPAGQQWDKLSSSQWASAGYPAPRDAEWIHDTAVWKTRSSATVWAQDPGGTPHALTYAEWAKMGFHSPDIR